MTVFWKVYDRIEVTLAVIVLVAMVATVLVAAIGRTVGLPVGSAPTFAQLFLIWTCMLGADVTLKHGQHIRVSALPDAVGPLLRRVIAGFNLVLILAFLVFIAWHGWELVVSNWARTLGASGLSYGFVTLALPVGAFLFAITLMRRLFGLGLVAVYKAPEETPETLL
ncbi:TRAP transporter small permease [Mesorhizobium xinjiangense]|uniref:TRAP transporter small permease n=1 Tax=Mesorhizobium xinjiangense TaxID=2678685 RepID=UPI0018DBDA22|nr:TRAP transporter small permease [Mesorhizobium xinjiangense]